MISVRLTADSRVASQAARLSDDTDQFCGMSAACRHISEGSQTGVNPCLRVRSIASTLLAGTRPGFRSHSIKPYCSMASMAI